MLLDKNKLEKLKDRILYKKIKREEKTQELHLKEHQIKVERARKELQEEHKVAKIIASMQVVIPDSDKTIPGSEPIMKSVWTEDEMNALKRKLYNAL